MNTPNIKKLALLCALLILSICAFAQHPDSALIVKRANKWLKQRNWAKTLKIKVYPDVNSVVFKQQYQLSQTTWDKVFTF